MRIINLAENLNEMDEANGLRHYQDSSAETEHFTIAAEHFLDIYINDILTMKVVCTPSHIPELVLGRLYSEGIIHSTDEVLCIYICQYASRARVILQKQAAKKTDGFVEITPTCCTGNRILTDIFQDRMPPGHVSPIEWKEEWIFQLSAQFEKKTPLFDATGSVHSCYLGLADRLLYRCEDLGRHNAVDKAIGCALRDNIDLTKCILFTSGRVPTDMVAKVIRAGIPILISKTTATDQAIQLAHQFGLTLIVYARENHFTVITHDSKTDLSS